MAATAGEAIGLPAAATPAVWLSQVEVAVCAERMLRQLITGIQPRERRITHVGSKNSSVQMGLYPCPWWALADKGEVVITT